MANVDKPNGAIPVGTVSGTNWMGHTRIYEVDASAGSIYPGDFVIMEADGKVAPATAGNTELLGVCVGVPQWMPNKIGGISGHNVSTANLDLMKKYHTTGDDVIYEMQEDGDASQLAVTDIGANVDLLATAGSTTTGRSQQELDSSSVTASTAQLRIIGLVDRMDNEVGSTGARWLVKMNESHLSKLAGI